MRDPRDTVVRLDSAPTQRPGLPRPTQPRAACLFVSKPRVRLTAPTKAPELPWQGWEDPCGPNYRPLPWKRSSLACRARLGR